MPAKTVEDIELAERTRAYVRREMSERKISQNEMASRLGLSSATLSRYMTSSRLPPDRVRTKSEEVPARGREAAPRREPARALL